MTTKRPGSRSRKEPMCRTEIPEEIQCSLDAVGGLEGLCSHLPTRRDLLKMSMAHHALSDPVRITILHLLKSQPLCVCVLKACIGIADSKLSYHLTILKKAELVDREQQGNWVIYRLTEKGRQFTESSA